MSQRFDTTLSFDGREMVTTDLSLAAALLSLSEGGAAWDGSQRLVYSDGGEEYERTLRLPETRRLDVTLAGHHCGPSWERVVKAAGWTAPDGRTYRSGEDAPFERVHYHLAGWYQYLTEGRVVRRVPWLEADFRFWLREFIRPGGMIAGLRHMLGQRDRLLTLNRQQYGLVKGGAR